MRCENCLYYRYDEDGVIRCYFPEGTGSRPCDKDQAFPDYIELPEDRVIKRGFIRYPDYWRDNNE